MASWYTNRDEANAQRRERLRTSPVAREKRRLAHQRWSLKRRVRMAGRPVPSGCELCGSAFDRPAHYDHNHETGKFRGWLCSKCNQGLGLFRDSPDLLQAAAAYLVRSKD